MLSNDQNLKLLIETLCPLSEFDDYDEIFDRMNADGSSDADEEDYDNIIDRMNMD